MEHRKSSLRGIGKFAEMNQQWQDFFEMQNFSTTHSKTASSGFFAATMNYLALAIASAAAGVFGGFYLLPPELVFSKLFLIVCGIATLALVFTSRRWANGSFGYALLILFAALIGVTMVPLLAYAGMVGGVTLIGKALLATVGMYGGLAIYSTTTQRDLSGLGGILTAGLIGMIVVAVVSFLLQIFGVQVWSSGMELVYSGFGVLLFAGFTAYDFQRVIARGATSPIEAAISLFLDFILLFEYILRFMTALASRD